MWFFIFLFLFFRAEASSFVTPLGAQEAFLGNAGVAVPASPGNMLYNAAGIAFLEENVSLSVAGTSIAYQEMDGSAFSETTGSLLSSTLLTTAIFQIEDGIKMGLYYAHPTVSKDYFRLQNKNATDERTLTEELQNDFATAGLAYSTLINSEIGAGINVSIGWVSLDRNAIERNVSATASSLRVEKTLEDQMTVTLSPGLLWQARPDLTFGLNLTWRALNISDEGESYEAFQESGQIGSPEILRRYSPDRSEFFGVTGGSQWNFKDHEILLDLTWSSHAPPGTNKYLNDDPYKSVSMGWKTAKIKNIRLLSGLQWAEWGASQNLFLSGGFTFKIRTLESNMGLFLQKSENRDRGGIYSDVIGVLYSSGMAY